MVTVEPNEEPVPAVEMTTEEFKELSAQPVGEEPESEIFKFSTDTFEESESQVSEHQNDVQTASLSVEKPTIAINTDVVDSAEIDTPSLITDVTSATGSSARPWTPSFQVTTVGRSISPVLEVEIADVETNSISVPVITTDDLKYEDMGDKSTMVSTELSEVEASLTPPRPWTPSYSVHSQGSPLLVAVNVDSSDGAVRDEDIPDVSEIEFAENPELPATNVSKPAESKHSPSLFAPAVQEPYVPEFPDILSDEVATMDDGTEKDVVIEQGEGAEGPLEEDENREAILNHPEILAGPSIIEPEPELIEELAGETPVLMHTMDENASGSIEETADVSIPSYFSPLFKAKECEETAEPAQSQEQAAIWVPSYSVSRQGSPLPKSQELPVSVDVAEDQSTSTCEATEAMESSASAPESLEASEVAPIVGADANEISALEELGSTRSLDSDAKEQLVSTSWVASYSVSRQGSPLPEVKSLSAGETENEPEVDTTESSNTDLEGTDEVADKSTTPVVVVTPDDKLVTVMESAPERPKSPWTPSYSVTSQGPASSAKSPAGLDNPIDIDVKATTNIQAEVAATSAVAIPVSEAKEVDTMENVSKHNIIEEQTPFPQAAEVAMDVPTLPSVDENTVSETTSAIAESTNTVPHEGRTSLEIAQGEFTSSKAIPTDDVSDIVPDSASESSTVPDDNATEAEEAEKEKKRGRWCVIM
ncbi:hypothetical protein BDQ17DRAFT_187816 [Cyathus striatus]|nr:hypothetical protein BDQ17DRAFT_187816 [Cyathus striatus]